MTACAPGRNAKLKVAHDGRKGSDNHLERRTQRPCSATREKATLSHTQKMLKKRCSGNSQSKDKPHTYAGKAMSTTVGPAATAFGSVTTRKAVRGAMRNNKVTPTHQIPLP